MDLLEHLMQEVEAPEPESPQGWKVDSPEKAEYAAWKIAVANADKAEKKNRRDEFIERAKAWYDAETKEDDNTIAFFTAALQDYVRRELQSGKTRKKSMNLLNGAKVKFTAQQPDFSYIPAALMAWAEANAPEYVTLPDPVLAWGELKKNLVIEYETEQDPDTGNTITRPVVIYEPTGEKLNLIEATVKPDTFKVDTKGVQL